MNITLAQAEKAIAAANQKATAIDTKMNIAIVYAGANLVAFARMDGAWLGSLDISIKKAKTARYFDGNGKQLATRDKPNLLEIAVFDDDTKNKQGMTVKSPLLIEKVWVKPGKSTFTFITKKLPVKAGIDPYNKMIDRIPDDNMKTVEKK